MFENQSMQRHLSTPVNSMEELFDFIETDNFYPFISNSQQDPMTTYLTPMEKFHQDQDMVPYQVSSREVMGSDDVSTMSCSDDSESSSESAQSQSPVNEDKEYFDISEWLIQDHVSRKVRPPKLYEFLRLLLNNPRYVSYASWINKNEGLFKIHRPSEVACLWKNIKVRRTLGSMDYDTFARGIRYYYKSGAMIKTRTRHTYCFARV
jgi:hypothetical protein